MRIQLTQEGKDLWALWCDCCFSRASRGEFGQTCVCALLEKMLVEYALQ